MYNVFFLFNTLGPERPIDSTAAWVRVCLFDAGKDIKAKLMIHERK